MPPKPAILPGKVTLANEPQLGGTATFHVESENPNLFVHLKGTRNGALEYEGWQRWFGTDDVSFILHSPALDADSGPAEFQALLEDWSEYSRHGKTTLVDELDFAVS